MNPAIQNKKAVVIVGGTRGLGRALSVRFGRDGYQVIALYQGNHIAACELLEVFKRDNVQGTCHLLDVATSALFPSLPELEEVVLIHCASASFSPKALHLVRWEEISEQLETAVHGGLRLLQWGIQLTKKIPRVTVIPILSTAVSNHPPKGFSAYATAKFALDGLAKCAASEYSARGLRLFSFSPGFMQGGLTEEWPESVKESILKVSGLPLSADSYADEIFRLNRDPEVKGRGETYRYPPSA